MLSWIDLDRMAHAWQEMKKVMAIDPGFTVLVCGGRDYFDQAHVFAVLDGINVQRSITLIIHGDAPGADQLAASWAMARECACDAYPADWTHLGRRAGPIRNQQMLDEGKPDLVVVFPGGRGTANMLRLAQAQGVPLLVVGIADHANT